MKLECYKLGDLCTITSSKRIFAHQYVSEGVPFYRSKEIIEKSENKGISEPLFISNEIYEEIKNKVGVPQEEDVLITSVGTLGIPYVVKKEQFYFKDGNLTWLKNFSEKVLSQYIYYWLKSKFGYDSLINRAIGSSQGAITIDILKKYKILIPDIEIQKKIVNILSKYDEQIENNNKRIKILEEMAENLYKEWFVRFRFPGYENAEFKNGIPKGWESLPLIDILQEYFNGGWGTDNKENNNIYQGYVIRGTDIPDIKNSNIKDIPLRYHISTHIESKQLKKDDIILELSNGNIDNIGRTLMISDSIIKKLGNVMCASFCKTLRCKNHRYSLSLFYQIVYMQNMGLLNFYKNTGTNGINNFNFKRFLKQNIICPSEDLLKRLEVYSILANEYRELNENLIKQRDALLPKLMSGKLEMK